MSVTLPSPVITYSLCPSPISLGPTVPLVLTRPLCIPQSLRCDLSEYSLRHYSFTRKSRGISLPVSPFCVEGISSLLFRDLSLHPILKCLTTLVLLLHGPRTTLPPPPSPHRGRLTRHSPWCSGFGTIRSLDSEVGLLLVFGFMCNFTYFWLTSTLPVSVFLF